jgi:quercetin dioxygenase-like cupin family protein
VSPPKHLTLSPPGALALFIVAGQAAGASAPPTFASLQGEVVLEDARVRVERFELQPGQDTGRHGAADDQLLVFIRGGVLTSIKTGRSTLWRDGRVAWLAAKQKADAGGRNTGTTPIVMICVTLKPSAAGAAPAAALSAQPLNYPNIPGEDLLENERVIVQRFIVQPGQWEGVHAHGPNMLFIHVKGGQWATRSKKEPEHPYPDVSPDGEVGWMEPIALSEGHESGNIGKDPIDLIWVTLKH